MADLSTFGGVSLFARNFLDEIDVQAFRENSLQLDEFLRGDFSSMSDELDKAFPNSPDLQERYVLFARRVSEEQATLYRKPPRRVWGGVSGAVADKLDEIWDASGFNAALHDLQMRAVLQRTMVVQVLPDHARRYTLNSYAPHEASVAPSPGSRWKDIGGARRVELLWPIGTVDERVLHGIVRYTQTGAEVIDGENAGPLYVGGGNPYGKIPLYTVRLSEPLRGRFFAPVAEDVLATQISLNLADSDIEALLHHQAWGQKVIETDGDMAPTQMMVEQLPVGQDRIMVLPVAGAKYRHVQSQPAIGPYVGVVEHRLKLAAMMHDMSPNRFSKANTAQTGAARAADAQDRQEARDSYGSIFLALERWMLAHVAETSRIFGDPVQIPQSARLDEIHYHAWEPPGDPQAMAQAQAMTDATGETSTVDRVALRFNVNREAAITRITRNLEDRSMLAAAPVQDTEISDDRDDTTGSGDASGAAFADG